MANATRTFAALPPAIMELGTIFHEAGEELALVGGPHVGAHDGLASSRREYFHIFVVPSVNVITQSSWRRRCSARWVAIPR